MRNTFRLLALFLSIPTLLYAQQTTPPVTATTPATQSTAVNLKTPEEFFVRARQLSDLEAAGIPFHLKATFVASDDAEFTGNGTIEEWWQSKDLWRKEAILGNYRWIEISKAGQRTVYTTSTYIPLRLRQAVDAVEIRIAPNTNTSSTREMQYRKVNGADLTVVSKPYSMGRGGEVVKQDYFTSDGLLQIRKLGELATSYKDFRPFRNLMIPRTIQVVLGPNQLLSISIGTLEPSNTTEAALNLFSSSKNFPPAGLGIYLAKGENPFPITQVPPTYPPIARIQKIEGMVVINATIDEAGKVREPYVLSSQGAMPNAAALEAVRQWQYTPPTLNGKPVLVVTAITVIFRLSL